MKKEKQNFWQKLALEKKPFFVLAPMADVTDYVQRQMLSKYGRPDVTYTEFVSADGLASEKGRKILLKELRFEENERPIVAQIFGSKPENIKQAARLIRELGFDGVDLNMGCPDKAVIRQGAGSALIKNPVLAREIIQAAKEGAGLMPVSVKTRIGFGKNEFETWLPEILAEKPAALTVHLRTKKEMSEVPAHWELAPEIVKMAKTAGVVIIGNGDVTSLKDGKEKNKKSGMDGIMIGRGIFGNPWFFNEEIDLKNISLAEKFRTAIEHCRLFEKELSSQNIKGYHVMKKHFKAYVSEFEGAKELRVKLMETENADQAEKILEEYEKNFKL
ncbi:MAG: tRNA-dihydrouridine synthase [Candidatus Moranbacteria bacterium]|nr:tRNA-dihydrouridine synthase [Candidatus Moranbacteria bacterium]